MKNLRLERDKKRGNLNRRLRSWHQRLGLVSVGFLLVLLISGVMLNHSHDLQLDQRPVKFSWLLDQYGITPPNHTAVFNADKKDLYITDNMLWHGTTPLLEAESILLAAAFRHDMIIAIDAQQLYLMTYDGKLVETQNSSTGLPSNLTALAIAADNTVWLHTKNASYQSDSELIEWQLADGSDVAWLQAQPLQSGHPVITLARGSHLSWQRVLQDLHSGRIFGSWAIWFWDLIAILLLAMLVLGVRIWWLRK
jgi:uncharacterized iron-regulated membrane protein